MTDRHSRQVLFRHVGRAGQDRLAAGRVLVVGLGATGGAIAASLARAGVGQLTLVDRDFPERSNLQRQALFVDADVDRGLPKAVAAAQHLLAIDPALEVRAIVTDFHAGNALGLAADHDVLVDGTDNFAARFILNDAAVRLERPWVYCAVIGAQGATMTIPATGQPCLRCLYPTPPPVGSTATCDTAGVLQPAVAAVAAVAALEVMKLLLGAEPLNRDLLYLDLWDLTWQRFRVPGRTDCATCATRHFPALDAAGGEDALATTLCGRTAVHLRPPAARLDLAALATRLTPIASVELVNEHLVRFLTGSHTITVFADGRAIVSGTADPAVARGLYARYVGL